MLKLYFEQCLKPVAQTYFKPILMTFCGPAMMGFGVASTNGVWEQMFNTGRAFFGLLTAMGGFAITIMGMIWWVNKLRSQRERLRREREEG